MMSNAYVQVLQAPGHSSTERYLSEINFVVSASTDGRLCELDVMG